ncbi:helix-turn-helix domain-containing protein [Paenibacillus sp. GCM10027627]|uniref:helix-turn-helix domain-containing protein n=1 Tax=unclassified Paenibacillus TaxID=185978 RepID=UPI00364580FF
MEESDIIKETKRKVIDMSMSLKDELNKIIGLLKTEQNLDENKLVLMLNKTVHDIDVLESTMKDNQKQITELEESNDFLRLLLKYSLQDAINYDLNESTMAERIKLKRLGFNMSPRDFADFAEMRSATYYKLESGESVNPTLKSLISLCTTLNCTIDWLVFGVDNITAKSSLKNLMFGQLKIQSDYPDDDGKYKCICNCENEVSLSLSELLDDKVTDCGHKSEENILNTKIRTANKLKKLLIYDIEKIDLLSNIELLSELKESVGYTTTEIADITKTSNTTVRNWGYGTQTMRQETRDELIELFKSHITDH